MTIEHMKGCQYARWDAIKAPCSCYERRLRMRRSQGPMKLTAVALGVRYALRDQY